MQSITVTLLGGLGNQMFQYALGRAHSLRTGLPLVLDRSRLEMTMLLEPQREYELDCFRLSGRERFWPTWLNDFTKRFSEWRIEMGADPEPFIAERTLGFDPAVLEMRGPCRLQGFWQSERYFESIAPQLREDFTFRRRPGRRAAAYLDRIRQANSVAVNFRRKDFVESSWHGVCSSEYYEAALQLVVERLGRNIELFIVSDEIEWCRENVKFPFPTTFVDLERQEPDYELMRLMSECRALIGANSTFSWWSGWMNPRAGKIVIAPRQWFAKPEAVSDLPNSPWLTAI